MIRIGPARQVSMFLYQKVHYVYNLGIGESYFMELLAIVVSWRSWLGQERGVGQRG